MMIREIDGDIRYRRYSKNGKLSSEGLVPRGPGQNLYLVDTLIPTNLYDLSGQQLENQIEQGGLDGQIYDARKDTLADSEITALSPATSGRIFFVVPSATTAQIRALKYYCQVITTETDTDYPGNVRTRSWLGWGFKLIAGK